MLTSRKIMKALMSTNVLSTSMHRCLHHFPLERLKERRRCEIWSGMSPFIFKNSRIAGKLYFAHEQQKMAGQCCCLALLWNYMMESWKANKAILGLINEVVLLLKDI